MSSAILRQLKRISHIYSHFCKVEECHYPGEGRNNMLPIHNHPGSIEQYGIVIPPFDSNTSSEEKRLYFEKR